MKYQIVAHHLKTGKEFRSVWNDYTEDGFKATENMLEKICENGAYLSLRTSELYKETVLFPQKLIQECVFTIEFDED